MKKIILLLLFITTFIHPLYAESISETEKLREKYIKIHDLGNSYKYVNKAMGYSFIYPKTWKIFNSSNNIGTVCIQSLYDKKTSIMFGYKATDVIYDINDLANYVLFDEEWEKEHYGTKTLLLSQEKLNNNEVIIWSSTGASDSQNLYNKQYYIPIYGDDNGPVWLRTITIQTWDNPEPANKSEVNKILSSYKIIA